MPKVGTEVIRARRGSKCHEVDIHFYKKTTDFRPQKLPEEFYDWHQFEISANTYDECVAKTANLLRDFWDASVKQRKMIAYKINVHKSSDQCDPLSLNSPGIAWNRRGPGPSLYVEYKMYWEVIIGGKKFYSERMYKAAESGGGVLSWGSGGDGQLYRAEGHNFSDMKFAPHTDALEAFFDNLKKSMNELVDKVETYFNVDPDLLESKVKNVNLLK